MTEILRQKLLKLVRGDDGVALVVTLALFMFLYVSCAGVYTVGRAVKDRIILQNAVDAAAYSAAVVQADYLSRIATINKAMAWTYKTLVRSQKNLIALKTLDKSNTDYLTDLNDKSNGKIADSLTGEQGYIGIRAKGVVPYARPESDVGDKIKRIEDKYGSVDEALLYYAGIIDKYSGQLDEMNAAIDQLRADLKGDDDPISISVRDVLMANLPFRLGELCRFSLKVSKDLLIPMSLEAEHDFLKFADDLETKDDISDFKEDWFPLQEGDEGAFTRSFDQLQTYWTYWHKTLNIPIQRDPGVDADSFRGDSLCSKAFNSVTAKPLILNADHFYKDDVGVAPRGAITVAVAKWNENPWKRLVKDLTGIHAAFDYVNKNDWTFAIASAQAGYRVDEDGSTGGVSPKDAVREYLLTGDGFIDTPNNLSVTDWDAQYLPVRMAFADETAFATWMENETAWKQLVPVGEREYITEPLDPIQFYVLNHEALPRMHNNAGLRKILRWDDYEGKKFLDLMYH